MPFFYAQKQGDFKFQISNFRDATLIIKLLRLEISDFKDATLIIKLLRLEIWDFKDNGLKSDSLDLKSEI